MTSSSDNNGGTVRHKRRSLAVDSLLREASQFLKSGQPNISDFEKMGSPSDDFMESQQPSEGQAVRRSARRLTHAISKSNCLSTPMKTAYHADASSEEDISSCSHSFIVCEDSMIQPSSPRDMFGGEGGLLEVEMESLQLKSRARRAARRKQSAQVQKKAIDTVPEQSLQKDSALPVCMETTFSGTFLAVCDSVSSSSIQDMEIEDNPDRADVDPDLVELYTNQKFEKPENAGLETIEETTEEIDVETSPIKSKRPRGAPKKKTKAKQPWRFIPHLVVNPPEIWWQELPVKKQAECRKKAREAGYRPATKKRLLEAEKKVQIKLDELDRCTAINERISAGAASVVTEQEKHSDDGATHCELSGECSFCQLNESTFNSLQAFVGDSSSLSSSQESTI